MKEKIKKLQEMVDVQCSDGNWNFDPYMHGMANGMIFCMALLEDETPEYLEAPKVWSSTLEKPLLHMGEVSVAATASRAVLLDKKRSKKECIKRGTALSQKME